MERRIQQGWRERMELGKIGFMGVHRRGEREIGKVESQKL